DRHRADGPRACGVQGRRRADDDPDPGPHPGARGLRRGAAVDAAPGAAAGHRSCRSRGPPPACGADRRSARGVRSRCQAGPVAGCVPIERLAAGAQPGVETAVKFEAELAGETIPIEVTGQAGSYRVAIRDEPSDVDAKQVSEGIWSLLIGDRSFVVDVSDRDGVSVIEVDGERYEIRVEDETRYVIRTRGGKVAAGGQVLKSPMPGKVVHIAVEAGQSVAPGDALVVLEAMKMENKFRATVAGQVKEIRVQVGQAVNAGDVLMVIG